MKTYLFQSERLGFRNWLPEDVALLSAINADARVMEFFPSTQSKMQTVEFIERMQKQFAEKRFCYFAVDKLADGEFIGFIGLSEPTFESDFTPCVDLGWRLKASAWKNGFATEGAKRCLDYAFNELQLDKLIAIAPKVNLKSENVMKKIGMRKVKEFIHPKLLNDDRLKECVLYEIKNPACTPNQK